MDVPTGRAACARLHTGLGRALAVAVLLTACSGAPALTPATSVATAPGPTAPLSSHTPAGTAAAGPEPVLGAARPRASGLGTARPSVIDLGGASSTGVVEDVVWQSWGTPTATGTGTAAYAAPGEALAAATRQRAAVVASDLGTCDGRPAYRSLTWYFPQHGEVPDARPPLDVCP
ncbi:hypothetical protein H7X46_21140 [Pseudonocardia sp. C8]|uniref:hypothetical protein n=1 Tax=Pseudonocardia sp. C8 TaxID=2762759 RepID=UPI00164274E8|nr:hypothetical protein [Pseudonocardia sp. C8]MBC3193568.1 hypothetical protein [Pseudonocardia sp. C8]